MTLAVDLRDEIRLKLAQKARAAGLEVPAYAALILEAEVLRKPLEETLRSVRKAFVKSGMSDEDLADRLEEEKHAAREAKQGHRFRE
jgi:hypothetical protein